MKYDAVLTEHANDKACHFLLEHVRKGRLQEDLCFALWRPSTGATRTSALIFDIVPPTHGDRQLHGNASFEPNYLTRAIRAAHSKNAGLAFMHNHLSAGWQDMSATDLVAERDRIAPPTRASGHPLVGLTLGTDGSWSARFWTWDGHSFHLSWCDKVRVTGQRFQVTFNDAHVPPPKRKPTLQRTIDTWGESCQRKVARLRVGIVGTGSVGCMVAEALARIGVENLVLIDPDMVEDHNLDRLLYAGRTDVGRYKVDLAAQHLAKSATAYRFDVQTHKAPIQQQTSLLAALDCDILFSAVDRPLPKDLLNRIAYAHLIPVISGGIFIDNKSDDSLGQAAWSVVRVGPERCCLRCDGEYSTSDVTMELDGSFDDPRYIHRSNAIGNTPVNQNVFPFSANLASFMVIEMVRMVISDTWWPDVGGRLHYSLIPGRLSMERKACTTHCSIRDSTATGDQFAYPFIIGDETPKRETSPLRRLGRLACDGARALLHRLRIGV